MQPGEQMCPKCGKFKPEEDFKTNTGKPTSYCEACRAIARASMKVHHERKRRGIQVQKGRPPVTSLFRPVYISVPVPVDLKDTIIAQINATVDKYLELKGITLPPGMPYAAEAAPPSASPTKAEPQRTSRSSKRGARKPLDVEFLNSCSPEFRQRMEKAERTLFDMEVKSWEAANKPELWQGAYKWQKALKAKESEDSA